MNGYIAYAADFKLFVAYGECVVIKNYSSSHITVNIENNVVFSRMVLLFIKLGKKIYKFVAFFIKAECCIQQIE